MDIVVWVLTGSILGWSASIVTKTPNEDVLTDLSLGVLGALVGGIILNIFGRPGISNLNLYSLTVTILGSIVLIWLGRTLRHA